MNNHEIEPKCDSIILVMIKCEGELGWIILGECCKDTFLLESHNVKLPKAKAIMP